MRVPFIAKAAVASATVLLVASACGGASDGAAGQDNPYNLITPGTILAATSAAQPPFTMQKQGSDQPGGFIIDLTNEAAKRLGLKVEYKLTPTASGIQGLSAKQYDMVANGLGITEARKKSIDFAKGMFWSITAALTKQDSPVAAMEQLDGKRVGVITGSVQEGYVKKIKGAQPVKFEGQDAAVSALNSGTIDAFLVGGPDAEEYLKQFKDLKIGASQPVEHATTVAFQKGNQALVDAFDKQLEAMVKDGTYTKTYNEYFTEKMQPQLLEIWPELKG